MRRNGTSMATVAISLAALVGILAMTFFLTMSGRATSVRLHGQLEGAQGVVNAKALGDSVESFYIQDAVNYSTYLGSYDAGLDTANRSKRWNATYNATRSEMRAFLSWRVGTALQDNYFNLQAAGDCTLNMSRYTIAARGHGEAVRTRAKNAHVPISCESLNAVATNQLNGTTHAIAAGDRFFPLYETMQNFTHGENPNLTGELDQSDLPRNFSNFTAFITRDRVNAPREPRWILRKGLFRIVSAYHDRTEEAVDTVKSAQSFDQMSFDWDFTFNCSLAEDGACEVHDKGTRVQQAARACLEWTPGGECNDFANVAESNVSMTARELPFLLNLTDRKYRIPTQTLVHLPFLVRYGFAQLEEAIDKTDLLEKNPMYEGLPQNPAGDYCVIPDDEDGYNCLNGEDESLREVSRNEEDIGCEDPQGVFCGGVDAVIVQDAGTCNKEPPDGPGTQWWAFDSYYFQEPTDTTAEWETPEEEVERPTDYDSLPGETTDGASIEDGRRNPGLLKCSISQPSTQKNNDGDQFGLTNLEEVKECGTDPEDADDPDPDTCDDARQTSSTTCEYFTGFSCSSSGGRSASCTYDEESCPAHTEDGDICRYDPDVSCGNDPSDLDCDGDDYDSNDEKPADTCGSGEQQECDCTDSGWSCQCVSS